MFDRQEAIEALVLKGKLCGRLTNDDIIDALASFNIGPDEFDELLERLVNEGVEVIDDADDDDLLANLERSPADRGKIEFDASARELLKWATWLALGGNAEEVDREHLLAAAEAKCPPPEPQKIWDIPFSARMQAGLARACVGMNPIDRNDILDAFGFDRSRGFTLTAAFGAKVKQLLKKRGVDTTELWRRLENFKAHDCMPRPEFKKSEAGQRWRRIASELGNRPLGQELCFLLTCILTDTSASSVLKESGVTEDLVVSLIKELPGAAQPVVEISPDIRRLFPWEPLSIEVLRSLELAWRFSDRELLRPDDLLPMLLTYGSQASLILESLGAVQDITTAIPTRVRVFEGFGSSPKLSPEVKAVLDIARHTAGDSPADTGHVLLGLAEIGHPLVAHLKQQIREALDGPL